MNISENTALFLEEAQELLERIETTLILIEQQPGNPEHVNEVFRALHTIKGSGAMFGFQAVSSFAHEVENLFDEVRKGKLAIDKTIIDLGLRSADCIHDLLRDPDAATDKAGILASINRIMQGNPVPPASAAPLASPPPQAAASPGGATGPAPGTSVPPAPSAPAVNPNERLPRAWRIVFKPQPEILHRGVRLEPLFQELHGLGICHGMAETAGLPGPEVFSPTTLYLSWTFTLSTSASEAEIRSVFMFVEDYAELSLTQLPLEGPAGEPDTPKLGKILMERGVIQEQEAAMIHQAQQQFGAVAVASGKARQDQVDAALAEQAIVRTTNLERETRQESATIRVRKDKLDSLIDLVGELVILQAIMEQEAKKQQAGAFTALSENLARLAADLRDTTMSIRMVPLEESFTSFQRLVRDLSQHVGKELQLEISGGSTELDKNVIEALKDPLVHIIRNSADHGIESPEKRQAAGKPRKGTIALGARQVGSRVEIIIKDDGAGLNIERIRSRAVERGLLDPAETDENRIKAMIFEPGFSTAEQTTGISGRGVGMDVVKRNIEKLRGEIRLDSTPGKGMCITLSIPLTLVIIEGLLVRIKGFEYVVTLSQVQECVDLTPDIRVGSDEGVINLRGRTIPVIPVREVLGIQEAYDGLSRLVIVSNEGSTVGLMVDAVVGRKQVVIKPLSSTIRRIKSIAGATILGDGSVALILDVAEIIKKRIGDQ